MAASYFMGSSSGIAKKSGNWFGNLVLLHLDQYGKPALSTFWFEDKQTYDCCVGDLIPGTPVEVHTFAGSGKVYEVVPHDEFPLLDLRF